MVGAYFKIWDLFIVTVFYHYQVLRFCQQFAADFVTGFQGNLWAEVIIYTLQIPYVAINEN